MVIVIWRKDVAYHNAELSEVQKIHSPIVLTIRPAIHDGVPIAVHHFNCLYTLKFTSLHVNQHAFPLAVLLLEADVVKPHITVPILLSAIQQGLHTHLRQAWQGCLVPDQVTEVGDRVDNERMHGFLCPQTKEVRPTADFCSFISVRLAIALRGCL